MTRRALAIACVFVCLGPAWGQTPEQKKATVAYLRDLQDRDGGFRPQASDPPGLRASSGALRALKYFGGEPRDRQACARFVARCFDPGSGGFADQPGGKPDVPTTAVGLMAVVELQMPREKYVGPAVKYLAEHAKSFEDIRIAAAGLEAVGQRPPEADAWLEQVVKMRNADGTYGKGDGLARDTGGAVVVVLRLGSQVESRERVLEALKAGQRPDGGFGKAGAAGSDLETTYRIMRAFHMLKDKPPDVPALRRFIAKCRTDSGGHGVVPGQPASVGGTYFASIILHWLDEK